MRQSDKYPILVEWSEEDEEYVATTPAFPYLSVLEASEQEAVREFRHVLGEVLISLNDKGVEPPEPALAKAYSGNLRLRLPSSLHGSLARAAKTDGVSLNTYILTRLAHAVGKEQRTLPA